MIRAAQVMDALFLRQVWAGNESMLLALQQDQSPIGRARLRYFLINKGPWSRLDHNTAVRARRAREAARRQLLRRRRVAGRGGAVAGVVAGAGPGGRHRLLHDDPARCHRRLHRRALQRRIPGRAGPRRGAPAGGGRSHHAAHAQGLPAGARGGVPQQRLLRQRREVDGARRHDRADHRPLRGLRGRVVQRQGGLRGLHHREGRRRVGQADPVRRRPAVDRRRPADRPEVPQSQARRAGADRRRQHRVLGRRRQSRRPDRGLQPAQRRARGPREGHQAGDAEEQPAGQVRQGAGADRAGGAGRRPIAATSRSTPSSPTS